MPAWMYFKYLRWKPMKKAPRDGTRILVYHGGYVDNFPVVILHWGAWGEGDMDSYTWIDEDGCAHSGITSWTHLPKLPRSG